MNGQAALAEPVERSRSHLTAVAYRMLGAPDEADDAVQETWLRASRLDVSAVVNITGWLTTIVGRVCLDMLRRHRRRREDLTDLAALDYIRRARRQWSEPTVRWRWCQPPSRP